MKTIALLSGGKDSILAVLMAYRYGHEPAVIVNMVPAVETADEALPPEDRAHGHDIDSYMYQTVGYEAVEAIAACLGLPLRRGCVRKGRAKELSLLYSDQPPAEDEVESLFTLIQSVKAEFPEVQGLTSGAILSNYQRNRVEFICDRLGLESLAYLWMREPAEVLDMAHALHVHAILVKTASIGLEPRRLIGKTLDEARPTLEKMTAQYQSHLAGEGGEYETTVLSCPLFRAEQLAVTSLALVMQDDNDISPSGHGLLTVACEAKSVEQQVAEAEVLERLRAGDIAFTSDVMPLLKHLAAHALPAEASCTGAAARTTVCDGMLLSSAAAAAGGGVEHRTYSMPLEGAALVDSDTAAAAVAKSLDALHSWAAQRSLTPFYFHLVLPDAAWEAPCRAAYVARVSHVCPPGLLVTVRRACTAATAVLDAEVLAAPSSTIQQHVLHAQSRSCWALGEPGPYAQTRRTCGTDGTACLFVSATPGRVPATRALATVRDLPEACQGGVAALVQGAVGGGEDVAAAAAVAADVAAQVLMALASCERYLALFQRSFTDVTHASFLVAPAVASAALLPALWQWATADAGAPVFAEVCGVVVCDALSDGEAVRVMMQCRDKPKEASESEDGA